MEKEKLEKKIDKITLEVVKHTEAFNGLVTRDEFSEKMERVLEGQDKTLAILNRLDQERVFTVERIRRLEEDVTKIKTHLALT